MAKITIGEGLWSTIYGYINSMFTELYNDTATNNAKVSNASHTGDVTGSTALTLATVNASPGSFTNASITVNAKGQVTSASNGQGQSFPPAGIALSTGSSWGVSVTNNSSNWNTAYSWGNHALAGYASTITVNTKAPIDNPTFTTKITTPAITLGSTPITATAAEINLLHNVSENYLGNVAVLTTQIESALVNTTPSSAAIDAAIGTTAALAGKNFTRIIRDTGANGVSYLVCSDGTNWFYIKFNKAL